MTYDYYALVNKDGHVILTSYSKAVTMNAYVRFNALYPNDINIFNNGKQITEDELFN